jgi:hypothetical protein
MKVCLLLVLVLVAVKAEASESQEGNFARTTRIKVVNHFYESEMLLTASFLQERRSEGTNQIIAEYQDYSFIIPDRNSPQELDFRVPFSRIKAFGLTLQYPEGLVDENSTCIAITLRTVRLPVHEMLVTINDGYFVITYQAKLPSRGQFFTQ